MSKGLNTLPTNSIAAGGASSSGGLKPPTLIPFNGDKFVSTLSQEIALVMCASDLGTTSATPIEVFNISGSGVIEFACLEGHPTLPSSGANATLIIDGIEVFNETSDLQNDRMRPIIGSYGRTVASTTDSGTGAFGQVLFNKSAVFSFNSDGVDSIRAVYRYYLT